MLTMFKLSLNMKIPNKLAKFEDDLKNFLLRAHSHWLYTKESYLLAQNQHTIDYDTPILLINQLLILGG